MSVETFLDGRVTLHCGDCMEVLRSLPDDSLDSGCMDPPYHLTSIVKRFGGGNSAPVKVDDVNKSGCIKAAYARASAGFMGKQWDGGDIAFTPELWREVYRVLKPGAYLLAFASTRGIWRMGVAIEDAGFIPHPMIAWVFGSGFPKATRIKADGYDDFRYGGQSLKPAIEPIFMGQKPFEKGLSGTANILKHGTGAVNIGACRVQADEVLRAGACKLWSHARDGEKSAERRYHENGSTNFAATPGPRGGAPEGRWPANLIHDGSAEVFAAFPSDLKSGSGAIKRSSSAGANGNRGAAYGSESRPEGTPMICHGDSGSAARFFYSAKADADDRIGSKHPTVKPVDLIRYLVRLITPPGGTVLDCFAGTGTTGEAAFYEGFSAVLIERELEYQADIRRRMALCLAGPDERKRESAKARQGDQKPDHGPLFSEAS